MNVSMKQKPDSQKPMGDQPQGPSSAQRVGKLMKQLEERPELLSQLEAIVSLAANDTVGGPLRSADEVETRVVEATRELGRRTMEHWAQEAQVRAIADCQVEHPKARV